MKKYEILFVFLLLFFSLFLYVQVEATESAEIKSTSQYGYEYKGKFIALNASERFVAISERGVKFKAYIIINRLIRHPLSERTALKQHKFGLYKLPKLRKKDNKEASIQSKIKQFHAETGEVIQPVFEQGQALLIPSDELILGFDGTVSLDKARDYIKPYMEKQGILKLREHRKNTFILSIDQPSNGRVYQVCRYLSKLEDVDFAEPNHIIVFLFEPILPFNDTDSIIEDLHYRKRNTKLNFEDEVVATQLYQTHSSVSWTVLIDESFEGSSLPMGWSTEALPKPDGSFTDSYWAITTHRSQSGTKSAYATGGGSQGVAAPGGYPNNCRSILKTPLLNLASYEEVYIELWFYAQFGLGFDVGSASLQSSVPEESSFLGFFYVDYPNDPTTANGWRRALLRVPPRSRVDGVKVEFLFKSDASLTGEGLYIDKVRVVGTTDVDTDPISNDKYSARQYEMNNSGQIAGIGGDANDMHLTEAWDLVSVSSDIVVAVIDSGVDKTHEDLNIFEGYEPDGSSGGAYRDSDFIFGFGYHGTAVAGNVGAIGNNSVGVIGSAPGVKIMPIYMGMTIAENASAIDVAVMKGADILSNSWAVGIPHADIENAIKDALRLGKTVLFAAGNGPDRPPYTYDVWFPANLTASTDVICVGASSPSDEHKATASSDGSFTWGSSYIGNGPDVVAPSPWSYTTDIQGNKGYNPDTSYFSQGSLIDPTDPSSENYTPVFGGTSSSTPKVAGIVALMLSANPNLTPQQVKMILRETADDIDVPGIDDKTGAGRVNAEKAVKRALALGTIPSPPKNLTVQ